MRDQPLRVLLFPAEGTEPSIASLLSGEDVEIERVDEPGRVREALLALDAAILDLRSAPASLLGDTVAACPSAAIVAVVDDDEEAVGAVAEGAHRVLSSGELDAGALGRALQVATARSRAQAALREREQRYALAVEGANDGLWDWHLEADHIHYSERWARMLGFEPEELEDTSDSWFGRIHEDDVEEVKRRLAAHVEGVLDSFEVEYRILHRDGSHRWMLARGLAVRDDEGRAYRVAGSQTDISKRKAAEMALQHRAWHDDLTGLPNRALLIDRLSRAMLRQRQHHMPFALLALCLDNYTTITDSYGHEICEEWTRAVADELARLRGATDTLARVGREQFVLLVDNPRDLAQVLRLSDTIQEHVQKPLVIRGEELFTTVSIGVVPGDGKHASAEDYLRDASVALNRARSLGGAQHRVFDAPMHRHVVEKLQLEKELRKGIDRGEFVVRYQPIVSLRTGRVSGFEALLRWRHPRRGLLAPAAFLDVAESAGLLTPIFDLIFPSILDQLHSWHANDSRAAPLFVNVNLSRGQFLEPRLIERIDRALESHRPRSGTIAFELTESMMVDQASVRSTLAALKDRGLRLLLDDFGTGYSSLSNLMSFPIDGIKIDRTFLRDLGTVDDSTEIIRAIVSLAHGMSMDVTVEGIETEDHLRFVTNLGCEYGQGYHFAKPIDVEHASETLVSGFRTAPPPSSGTQSRGVRERGRVYLVDDDRSSRNGLRVRLEGQGFEVVTASSGPECVENAATQRPDVILMEIDLEGMGGIETCRRLGQSPQTAAIPVLFLSGDKSEEIIVDALRAGGNDFVRRTTPLPILCARLDSQVAIGRTQRRLSTISMVDELTGMSTQRFVRQALRRSVRASTRNAPEGLALMMIDLDRLKQVNATKGVIEGDRVLRDVARTMAGFTREHDIVARYGGEEFVVVLDDVDLAEARRIAEHMRAEVEGCCDTTVSLGVAFASREDVGALGGTADVDGLLEEMLHRAEVAMGRAKRAGRNRVAFEHRLGRKSADTG